MMDFEVQDFQKEVLEDSFSMPVVVDFWAPWCTPCLWLEPVITVLAMEQKENWKLVKVNTDIHHAIAAQYAIQSIPTICVFKNGVILAQYRGVMYKNELADWINSHIK